MNSLKSDSFQSTVSPYAWLIAPGDRVQNDYATPTVIKRWLMTDQPRASQELSTADKQLCYGQWLAQVLQNQLGVPLVERYTASGRKDWPLTLREDVIAMLDEYFVTREATAEASVPPSQPA